MLVFILIVLCGAGFALTTRAAQRRDTDTVGVGAVNYAFAALIACTLASVSGPAAAPETLRIGILGGITYVVAYLFLLPSLRQKGTAIAASVMQLGVLVPIAGALLIWAERPEILRAYGMVLAVLALPLLTLDKGVSRHRLTLGRVMVLLGLFLLNGLAMLVNTWFHTTGLEGQRTMYLAILFSVAAVGCTAAWLLRPERKLGVQEAAWGLLLGAFNVAATLLTLYGLDLYLASVLFPLTAALTLALITAFAAIAWREIPGKIGWVGIAVALSAVVLANM